MIDKDRKYRVRAAIAGVLVFYAVAGVLNGRALERQARLMPYGPARRVCLLLVQPLAVVSGWGPDRIRAYVETKMEAQREKM